MRLRQNQKPTVKTTSSLVLKYAALGAVSILLIFGAVFVYNNFINIGDSKAESQEGIVDGGGYSLYLDGENDYLALPDPVNDMGTLEQFTVEAWINLTVDGTKGDREMPIIDFDEDEYFSLTANGKNGKIRFTTMGSDGSSDYIVTQLRVNDGGWHHVAAVYDGKDKFIYVDGKMVKESINPHKGNAIGTGKTRYGFIGVDSQASSFDEAIGEDFFKGSIDELRIWTVGRSLEDIRSTLTEKLSGNEANLYANYTFNEGQGTEVSSIGGVRQAVLNGGLDNSGWEMSGIYMGDTSIYTYTNNGLSFEIEGKGTVNVEVTSGSADGIHIYFVGQSPGYLAVPDGIMEMENFYWGVYAMGDVSYTFSYDYSTYSGSMDTEMLEVVERPNRAGQWIHGEALKLAGINNMVLANQTGTEYILATSATPMPIELLSFNAKAQGSSVKVSWTTSSEINNDFFTIERSRDGKKYESLGTIKGAGNSDEPISYEYKDDSPLTGRSYYRLKQTDFDEKYEYFSPVMIDFSSLQVAEVSMNVYPNPSINQVVTVRFEELSSDETVDVQVLNMQGGTIYQGTTDYNNELTFDPSSVPAGTYIVVANANGTKLTKQLIIRK